MNGTLSEGALPGLLREIYVGRRTGLLHFTKGDERRSVLFRRGHIVHANTNIEAERLGEMLVRQGALSSADLAQAGQIMSRDGKRLGVVLQQLGILDEQRLEHALAQQVREILLGVFAWGDGSYSFVEQDSEAAVDEDLTLKVSTGEMILEAVRRVQDPEVIRFALGDLDRILGLSTDPLLRFQKITLTPSDGYVLSRVDGTLSAREVIELVPLAAEDTQRSLFGLLCTGIVEHLPLPPKVRPGAPATAAPGPAATPAPERPHVRAPAATSDATAPRVPRAGATPEADAASTSRARRQEILDTHASLKEKNHFEVLGIPRASSEAQVKDAYFRLARRFHPDTQHDPALADLASKIEAVFIRLGQAYEVLRNPRTRASYEERLPPSRPQPRIGGPANVPTPPPAAPEPGPVAQADPALEARLVEESIRAAEKRFAEEKYWDVIQLLEPNVAKAQGRARSRVRILLARAYVKNPKWLKRGEEELQAVVQDDPGNVDAYLALAGIYKTGGLKSRASAMFRKVLELKPDHEEALAEIGSLPAPEAAAGGKRGLLRRLFGKS